MPEHKPIVLNGYIYNTIRDAWRVESPEGLPEITVRKRLLAGWEPEVAFTLLPIPPTLRRRGHI